MRLLAVGLSEKQYETEKNPEETAEINSRDKETIPHEVEK